ncbi:hypothetical protein MMC29_006989 [Sticta canariensis]|nr:hypothetical protein [Sticta canariensis]
MPEPPPEFEIFRCKNYLLRDPPCQGWVKAQGIKCNTCIANGWSFNPFAPSAGGLAQQDSFDVVSLDPAGTPLYAAENFWSSLNTEVFRLRSAHNFVAESQEKHSK